MRRLRGIAYHSDAEKSSINLSNTQKKEVKKMQRVCRNCKFCLVDPGMEEYDPDPFYCDLTVEKTDPEHKCRFFEGFEPKTIEKR